MEAGNDMNICDKLRFWMRQLTRPPYLYYLLAFISLLVYQQSLNPQSCTSKFLNATNEAILELGETGVFATIREALNFESNTMRVVRDLALLSIVLRVGHWLWVKSHRRDRDYDIVCPPAYATPSFTKRLALEKFEFQKMETTRLALEKLTASEEYKRYDAAKKESRKKAVSTTVLDADVSEDEKSANDLGNAAGKHIRHNQTMIHEAQGLDDGEDSALALSNSTRRNKNAVHRKKSSKETREGLGLIKHRGKPNLSDYK